MSKKVSVCFSLDSEVLKRLIKESSKTMTKSVVLNTILRDFFNMPSPEDKLITKYKSKTKQK